MILTDVKTYLPRGYAELVSDQLGVSRSLVYKVMTGKRNNAYVEAAIKKLVLNHKNKMTEITDRIETP